MITPDYRVYVPGQVEYFNGYEWTPIREYRDNDYTLQYTKEGFAQLVLPTQYKTNAKSRSYAIASPNSMFVCGDWAGRIPYKSSKSVVVSLNMSSIIEKIENGIFRGKFIGAFQYNDDGIPMDDDTISLIIMLNETEIESWDDTTVKTSICRPHQVMGTLEMLQRHNIRYEITSHNAKRVDLTIYDCPDIKAWKRCRYSFSTEQAVKIAAEMLKWNDNKYYTTSSIDNANYYQFVVTSIGKRAIMKKNKSKYTIRVANTAHSQFPKDLNIDERYRRILTVNLSDKKEYCLQVPSGMPIFRYRYNIFVAGGPLLT